MSNITIRNLDEETKERRRARAARRKHSMEYEAPSILREALARGSSTPTNLAESIGTRFAPLGGIDLYIPLREPVREPLKLGK